MNPFLLNRPEDAQEDFILPGRGSCGQMENEEVQDDAKVRIAGAADMGYSGRGTGFTYDSLNGYSALVGLQSKKVISFATENRACRMCSSGHPKWDHDCRLNFHGSAKAMEAEAAVRLVTANPILKSLNLELGIFIGDNDSSSFNAVEKKASHPVIKLADKNHTIKVAVENL